MANAMPLVDRTLVVAPWRVARWLAAGAAVGIASWGEGGILWFLLLLPAGFAFAPTRVMAFSGMLGYYLAAARGLPEGTAVFFGSAAPWWFGWAFWLTSSVLLAVPYGLLWSRVGWRRGVGFTLALLIVAVPPFSLIGWCNPIAVAGELLPGSNWYGLVGVVGLLGYLAAGRYRMMILTGALVAAIGANALWTAPTAPANWRGFDTDFSRLASGGNDAMSWHAAKERLRWIEAAAPEVPAGATLLLPETLLGPFGGIVEENLGHVDRALALRGSRMLVGAEILQPDGRYLNGLIVLGKDGLQDSGRLVLQQGLPVPISMWKPFSDGGTVADLWGRGSVAVIGGERVAALICYEQLLSWPMWLRAVERPTVVVAASNVWWARDTSIPAIQTQTVASFARLFGWPVVSAVNT